jgi:hypothetical protein
MKTFDTLYAMSTPRVAPIMAGRTRAQKVLGLVSSGMNANKSIVVRLPTPEMISSMLPGRRCMVNPPTMARTIPPAAMGANQIAVRIGDAPITSSMLLTLG